MAKNYKRKPRKNTRKGTNLKLIADRMKITKCHKPSGLEQLFPFGRTDAGIRDSSWWHYPLANLPAGHNKTETNVGDNYTVDLTKRESVRVFHKNTTVEFTLIPAKNYIEPLQYRYVMGYFKGDDNVGTQQLTNAILSNGYPNIHSRMKMGVAGRNDFYFTYVSPVNTMTPKMIYDANGSDDSSLQTETMNAIWLPKRHKANMRCNKIRQFESDEADSLDGWNPFFAIQCLPVVGNSGFNAPDIITDESAASGLATATPQVQMEIGAWFQDIN